MDMSRFWSSGRAILDRKNVILFLFGFLLGLLSASRWLFSLNLSEIDRFMKPSASSTPSVKSSISLTQANLGEFYEEYYKYYELSRQWRGKTYLGVAFLQNPNDAITIIELLYQQDVDLVIETGTYRGGAALFFASIMYQYRYDAKEKFVRPFKIITMDITSAARQSIDRFPLLASYITFIPQSSAAVGARSIVNETFFSMKPKNVFISLDGDHLAEPVYEELLFYQQFVNVNNYILVQDTRLSRKWHRIYCTQSTYDGPCNGPQEAVNQFLKKEGRDRFEIDRSKEYLFSTHHKGWLKRIA